MTAKKKKFKCESAIYLAVATAIFPIISRKLEIIMLDRGGGAKIIFFRRNNQSTYAQSFFVMLLFLCFSVHAMAHAAPSDSLQKRKEAIFNLANRIGELKNPTKVQVEKIIGRQVWAEGSGRYTSEFDEKQDIRYFEVPYDQNFKITCINLVMNPKFDIELKDVMQIYGKWKSKFDLAGNKDFNIEPVTGYVYEKRKIEKTFKFRKKNQNHLESILVIPSTTPVLKLQI